MTFSETAAAMRNLADGIDRVVRESGDCKTDQPKPILEGDAAVGAAVMLCYLRDLFTATDKEAFDRPSILVILEAISRDAELFPCGVGQTMWAAEPEEEDLP